MFKGTNFIIKLVLWKACPKDRSIYTGLKNK